MSLILITFLASGKRFGALGIAFFAVVLASLPATPATASGLEVKDIRIGVYEGSTRFVVDLSDEVEPRVFGLPDPFRVVIDLPEVNFSLSEERIGDGAGLIDKLRYGLSGLAPADLCWI